MKPGMKCRDNQEAQAEVNMSGEPSYQIALVLQVRTLAIAKPHQPQDQECADRAERVPGPAAAVAGTVWRIEQVKDDGNYDGGAGDLEVAELFPNQEGFVPAQPAVQS